MKALSFACILLLAPLALIAGTVDDNRALPDFAAYKALLKSKKPVTWVITGDSITHGAMHTHGVRSYPEHFNERVRWELRRTNDVLVNTGVSGEQVDGLLNAFDFRIGRFKPDFVSVNLGMNDCRGGEKNLADFRTKMTRLVSKIRALGAIPVLQVPNSVKAGDARAANLPAYSAAIREIAAKEKVLLVDHLADWDKKSGKPNVAPNEWLNDSIHPNPLGHAEMARTMFRDLDLYDQGSPTSKFIPR